MDAVVEDFPRATRVEHRVDRSTLPDERLSIQKPDSDIRNPLVLLCLVTLLGAFLRLISLDQPALWGDEAFTYSRVCGSFRQMLDVLQFNGFMPLHYIVMWWVGQNWGLSPTVMRLTVAIPAIFATPAMYMLARQLSISARTSLVVALFTACSAYMLTYARDAKMYAPFWTFCILHVACLLWWLRGTGGEDEQRKMERPWPSAVLHFLIVLPASPSTFRFLCWLTTGALMMGYHALGLMVIGVEAIIFITAPRPDWRKILPFAAGLMVMYGLKKLHFEHFSDWERQVTEENNWWYSGLGWVNGSNYERSGMELVRFTATAFLFSWEWPQPSWQRMLDPRVLKTLITLSTLTLVLATLGLLCLRRRAEPAPGRVDTSPTGELSGVASLPKRPFSYESNGWWRPVFWVAAWLIVLSYGVYARSIPLGKLPYDERTGVRFVSPMQWVRDAQSAVTNLVATNPVTLWLREGHHGTLTLVALWTALTLVLFGVLTLLWLARRRAWMLTGVGVIALNLAILLAAAFYILQAKAIRDTADGERWHSVWMPRYVGVLWPAFIIALVVLLMRLPTRPLRFGALLLLIVANLTQFSVRTWGGSEPRTDLIARDIANAQPMYVRQQQLTLDLLRQAQNQALGLPVDRNAIPRQLALLPLEPPRSRVFLQTGQWSPAPGGGVIGSFAMRMYLVELVGIDTTPAEFRRRGEGLERLWHYVNSLSPRLVNAEIRADPSVERVITWERLEPGRRDINRDDPLLKTLGSSWRRADEKIYPARDHWTWMHLYELRRREYVRVKADPPATQATQPAR